MQQIKVNIMYYGFGLLALEMWKISEPKMIQPCGRQESKKIIHLTGKQLTIR